MQAGANASKNYGSATTLRVQTNSTAAKNYDSYLKFDASSATGTVTSAKLRVYAKLSASGTVSSSAYAIATTTWGETTLTWNNKPARGAALGNISVTSTGYAWKEIDVTAYVQGEFNANRKLLSFAYNSGTASSLLTTLQSREGTNKPQLVIITSNAEVTGSGLSFCLYKVNGGDTGHGVRSFLLPLQGQWRGYESFSYSGTIKSCLTPFCPLPITPFAPHLCDFWKVPSPDQFIL